MKYCYNCNRITPGQPLFCNSCGRSYNIKLCPRRHVNPRTADACSQCGSRELSTPQPRVPTWVPVLEFLVSVVPGIFLTVASILFGLIVITALVQQPGMIVSALFLFIALGILWSIWSELPQWFRSAIYKVLKRRREGGHGGNE